MSLPQMKALLETIDTLRDPGGCPWDRKQTLPDAARYLLDEAGELVDAAVAGDDAHAAEELGDLLFMVAFCCRILSEQAPFDFEAVARGGNEKLIRRHPHVFSEETADGHEESQVHWNAIKDAEKRAKGIDPEKESLLKDLPASSSPLRQAHSYQKDAARLGFDWPSVDGVWDKVREELGELEEAAAGDDPDAVKHEVGDVLQAVVNLSRHLGVEADDALRLGNQRFARRFRSVESNYERPAEQMPSAGLDALEAQWRAAKLAEREG